MMNIMAVSLNNPTRHVHFGPFTVSIANLVMYFMIVVLFTAPLFVATFRIKRRHFTNEDVDAAIDEKLKFIAKYIYFVNSIILAALIIVCGSGLAMALRGPSWEYVSPVSRFFHAIHFWSVQILFLFVLLHILGNFWRSGWQKRAFAMWASGAFTYFVLMFAAFTGGLVANNHNSQWIALQSKNVANSLGLGAFFNTLNLGQMLTLHTAVLPVAIVSLLASHLALVRGRTLLTRFTKSAAPKDLP